ncbi:unnamed protein product [Heligmosomoides polygyrus]|uniref:ING domain-containing protein n=1 Tax=Heligmosomoides polygyrus TaxID=6339 RepID=A0A3P8CPU5_HELPZ|nr:unnamed protein product [Heligmosomoides polygyrus]
MIILFTVDFISSDGHVELDEIKATCERHADLCQQYAKCSLDLQMNDAQLEILSETAETLRQRHAEIRRIIDEKPRFLKEAAGYIQVAQRLDGRVNSDADLRDLP